MQSYLRIKPFWIYKTQDKTLKNQPTVWHYFTSTLTTHSAVKKVLFIHKHFDTTWSSQKTTSAGRPQWPNTYSIGLRTCCNTHIHCTSSKTKKSLEKKKKTHSPLFCHPNPYQPIPNPAVFTTVCPLCTSIWLLTGGFQTLLPIYTHIHPHTPIQTYPQWYNYSYIPTVAAFFRPPPYQTQPTNLGSTENTMEYQGYGDQGITQRLQDTPKHSLLCWLCS